MKRIVVIANKTWEADAMLAALTSAKARSPRLLNPSSYQPYFPADPPAKNAVSLSPRAIFELTQSQPALAEIWCIQDLMDPTKSSSSTTEKARVIPTILAFGATPAVVIAMGTAASPGPELVAGGVVLGMNTFAHDPYAASATVGGDGWTSPLLDQLLESLKPSQDALLHFVRDAVLRTGLREAVEARLLRPPVASAATPTLRVSTNTVAVSVVNVTNPDDYAWTDVAGLNAFAQAAPRRSAVSLETTHGVIRIFTGAATSFLFVSGLANRVGFFDGEVAPREYAQNFVAAHNAGVAIGWILPLFA